jgi:DinB superfamily
MASQTTKAAALDAKGVDSGLLVRILEEGHGPGAWHGANIKDALDDVSGELAYWRPNPNRHSIAEIALHHAYCLRGVRGKLTGEAPEPFVIEGDDWFPLASEASLAWPRVVETLEVEQRRLVAILSERPVRRLDSSLGSPDVLDLVLGITCHAVYHAGQIQLLKRWRGEQ